MLYRYSFCLYIKDLCSEGECGVTQSKKQVHRRKDFGIYKVKEVLIQGLNERVKNILTPGDCRSGRL